MRSRRALPKPESLSVAAAMFTPEAHEATREKRRSSGPIQGGGHRLKDVAWATAYLVSNALRWIMGQVLVVEARLTLTTRGDQVLTARPQ